MLKSSVKTIGFYAPKEEAWEHVSETRPKSAKVCDRMLNLGLFFVIWDDFFISKSGSG